MLSPYLLTVVGLVVVAATEPHDFSKLCSSPAPGGECPTGWKNVDGDCIKFAGWDQAKAKELCREEGAEYEEYSDSAGLYLLSVCLERKETRCKAGFIITGGGNSTELWNPSKNRNCPLPDLPEEKSLHSQCGNLLCHFESCLKMDSTGSFLPLPEPFSLLQRRLGHLCWSLPGGGGEVMLLGGGFSPNTTEVISSNFKSTKPSWDLKYQTQ